MTLTCANAAGKKMEPQLGKQSQGLSLIEYAHRILIINMVGLIDAPRFFARLIKVSYSCKAYQRMLACLIPN